MNDLKIYSKFIANLIEMEATQKEYQEIVSQCRSLFEKKMKAPRTLDFASSKIKILMNITSH